MANNYINEQIGQPYIGDTNKSSYLGKLKVGSGQVGVSGKNNGKDINLTKNSSSIQKGTERNGSGGYR